jgi:hypothetical protein
VEVEDLRGDLLSSVTGGYRSTGDGGDFVDGVALSQQFGDSHVRLVGRMQRFA